MVKSGTVYDQAPEEVAFHRWQQGKFHDVERLSAALWRHQLADLDLKEVAKIFRSLGVDGKACKSLDQARDIARAVVSGTGKPYDRLKLAILFFDVPQHLHSQIIQAWHVAGQPSLSTYAPYAAFVLTVEIFFQVALAASLISADRPSNRTDIAYLFYLPFSMAFASSDKLHQRCAPLFLRQDQEFIWGLELKSGLRDINEYFLQFPNAEREKGVMKFARNPPVDGLIGDIWDRHMRPGYRDKANDVPMIPEAEAKLVKRLKAFRDEPTIDPTNARSAEEHEMLSIERHVRRKRGSWWQVPKDLPDQPDRS